MTSDQTRTGLHIGGIKECPAGHDDKIAEIFGEMRRAVKMSVEELAKRLDTRASTIESLENGAVSALPDWPEISRVVTTYANILNLDSRPILRRIAVDLAPEACLV